MAFIGDGIRPGYRVTGYDNAMIQARDVYIDGTALTNNAYVHHNQLVGLINDILNAIATQQAVIGGAADGVVTGGSLVNGVLTLTITGGAGQNVVITGFPRDSEIFEFVIADNTLTIKSEAGTELHVPHLTNKQLERLIPVNMPVEAVADYPTASFATVGRAYLKITQPFGLRYGTSTVSGSGTTSVLNLSMLVGQHDTFAGYDTANQAGAISVAVPQILHLGIDGDTDSWELVFSGITPGSNVAVTYDGTNYTLSRNSSGTYTSGASGNRLTVGSYIDITVTITNSVLPNLTAAYAFTDIEIGGGVENLADAGQDGLMSSSDFSKLATYPADALGGVMQTLADFPSEWQAEAVYYNTADNNTYTAESFTSKAVTLEVARSDDNSGAARPIGDDAAYGVIPDADTWLYEFAYDSDAQAMILRVESYNDPGANITAVHGSLGTYTLVKVSGNTAFTVSGANRYQYQQNVLTDPFQFGGTGNQTFTFTPTSEIRYYAPLAQANLDIGVITTQIERLRPNAFTTAEKMALANLTEAVILDWRN